MAKFLLHGSYTQAGFQGVVKEGFADREAYVRTLMESLGAKIEAFYWAYGQDDVILVVDAEAPAVAAMSLAVNQSGAIRLSTTPLLVSAEMDDARTRIPEYRAPGA